MFFIGYFLNHRLERQMHNRQKRLEAMHELWRVLPSEESLSLFMKRIDIFLLEEEETDGDDLKPECKVVSVDQ